MIDFPVAAADGGQQPLGHRATPRLALFGRVIAVECRLASGAPARVRAGSVAIL